MKKFLLAFALFTSLFIGNMVYRMHKSGKDVTELVHEFHFHEIKESDFEKMMGFGNYMK